MENRKRFGVKAMKQYCKILKEWGGFAIGAELWIGEPKAGHLKSAGTVEYINPPKKKSKVETATVPPMSKENTETTIVTPKITEKSIDASLFDKMKKGELLNFASKNNIDLDGAKNKPEIKNAIIKAIIAKKKGL